MSSSDCIQSLAGQQRVYHSNTSQYCNHRQCHHHLCDKKIDMCLPKALHNLHLPESLSEDTFLSSPLLDEGVSDLVLSEPVLPIGLLALDLNSYYSTRMF